VGLTEKPDPGNAGGGRRKTRYKVEPPSVQGGFLLLMSRIVIFANGILNQPDLTRSRLHPTDRIFCADGGARHALALGLTPHAIIGDLDSLPPELVAEMEAAGVAIHRHPMRKDQTDLELALEVAIAEKPDEILLFTALGGRLDHTLANILLLAHPKYASVRFTLVDGPQWAILLHSHQSITIRGQPGDTLSLIPLSPKVSRVTLTGVEWPLEKATLSLGSTWTISNSLVNHQVTLQIGEGMVLLVHSDKDDEEN
jgi:thiamine pyrophosphokinase